MQLVQLLESATSLEASYFLLGLGQSTTAFHQSCATQVPPPPEMNRQAHILILSLSGNFDFSDCRFVSARPVVRYGGGFWLSRFCFLDLVSKHHAEQRQHKQNSHSFVLRPGPPARASPS